jgi:hypothetical protein
MLLLRPDLIKPNSKNFTAKHFTLIFTLFFDFVNLIMLYFSELENTLSPGGPTTISHKGLYHNKIQTFFILEVIYKLYFCCAHLLCHTLIV